MSSSPAARPPNTSSPAIKTPSSFSAAPPPRSSSTSSKPESSATASDTKPSTNPRCLDFAAHYGFEPRACTVRKANEKGRVENAVGYVKKNLLAGLDLPNSLSAINTAARHWLDNIANVRDHKETRQQPAKLFAAIEKPALRPLPPVTGDISVARTARVTPRCRIVLDTNEPCALWFFLWKRSAEKCGRARFRICRCGCGGWGR